MRNSCTAPVLHSQPCGGAPAKRRRMLHMFSKRWITDDRFPTFLHSSRDRAAYSARQPLLDDLLAIARQFGSSRTSNRDRRAGGGGPEAEADGCLNGWPEGWFAHYIERHDVKTDGVSLFCATSHSCLFLLEGSAGLVCPGTLGSLLIAGEAAEFGIRSAFRGSLPQLPSLASSRWRPSPRLPATAACPSASGSSWSRSPLFAGQPPSKRLACPLRKQLALGPRDQKSRPGW